MDIVSPCDSIRWFSGTMSAFLFLFSITCTIFGTYRGGYNKKFNAHSITLAIQIISTLYGMQAVGAFCDFQTFSISEVPIFRNLTTGIIIVFATAIITHRMGETTVDIVVHIIFAVISQILWILASTQFMYRRLYLANAIYYSCRLLWHIFSETRTDHCQDSRHATRNFFYLCLYIFLFYTIQFFGPLFVGIISFEVEEILLALNDVVILCSFFFIILHYGWIERLNKDSSSTHAGFFSALSPEEQRAYTSNAHSLFHT